MTLRVSRLCRSTANLHIDCTARQLCNAAQSIAFSTNLKRVETAGHILTGIAVLAQRYVAESLGGVKTLG